MHIHILGICGTFMGGIAALAKHAGHTVSGCDSNVYPPMSTQLASLGIELIDGWDVSQLALKPDLYLVGNVVSRGNPLMEAILDRRLPFTSGPQWLSENVLRGRQVIAVAGTHGKTTTSSLAAFLLDRCGLAPGFLIGGVPSNFGVSARLGDGEWFVIEADEYDTAFFDKRAKFVHYHPTIAVLNNLEFDHADIYADLAAIEWQFHQLMRIVPSNGYVVHNATDPNLQHVLSAGCWSSTRSFSTDRHVPADLLLEPGAAPEQILGRDADGQFVSRWAQQGAHNLANTAAALLAVRLAGGDHKLALEALAEFLSVARRMQTRFDARGIRVFDDFAHHPTAIRMTLEGARRAASDRRQIAIFEPRSNTMRRGVHADQLAGAFESADQVLVLSPDNLTWDLPAAFADRDNTTVYTDSAAMFMAIQQLLAPGDDVILMSNGSFDGLPGRLVEWLESTDD
ncbi:MAG: UDP-N-acetylmuramate:L-alanyl-gamma-D-glutamyl-meso-diaminopimelate ligase [Pseudomonadota bacterium]